MGLTLLRHQEPWGSLDGIVAHDVHEDEQRRRLTVLARAFHEQKHLLRAEPREAVAEEPVDEVDDLFVATHRVVEEGVPVGTLSVVNPVDGADFGQEVCPVVGRHLARP